MPTYLVSVTKTMVFRVIGKNKAEATVLAEFAANGDLTESMRERTQFVSKTTEATLVADADAEA
jgi:hypothetical protein